MKGSRGHWLFLAAVVHPTRQPEKLIVGTEKDRETRRPSWPVGFLRYRPFYMEKLNEC